MNDYENAILARQDWQEVEDDGEALHFIHSPKRETEIPCLTVEDIIMSDLVNSETMITIGCGPRITAGRWFEDNILESLQGEVKSLYWDSMNAIQIELKKEV